MIDPTRLPPKKIYLTSLGVGFVVEVVLSKSEPKNVVVVVTPLGSVTTFRSFALSEAEIPKSYRKDLYQIFTVGLRTRNVPFNWARDIP